MAYRVKSVKRTKGPQFKVQFESFENGARKTQDIPKERWPNYGFAPGMTIEQAREVRDSLNSAAHLERHQVRRAKIEERLRSEDRVECAYLPDIYVREFEEKTFKRRSSHKKLPSYWRQTKATIRAIALPPKDWGDNREAIYDHFSAKGISVSYVQKLIGLLNKYGAFYCRKSKEYFEEITQPTGVERERIADANHVTPGKGNKKSDPITPGMLEGIRASVTEQHYNWLFISIWLGLRPQEVCSLKDVRNFRISKFSGVPVIEIYQPKLVALPREKRWKSIPCFLPEMQKAVELAKSGKFKRPLQKSVIAWFGDSRIGLYGGRKGFTELMHCHGQSLEDISAWMGHTSVDRTWKDYKDKSKVNFTKRAG